MTGYKRLAKIIKKRDNPKFIGPTIGIVVSEPPEIKISILSGKIMLDKNDLYINASVLSDYSRSFTSEGLVDLDDSKCGQTDLVHDGGYQATSHKHILDILEVTDGMFAAEGEFTLTNTLKKDDEVLLLPTNSNQKFFLICKVKKLGD